MSQVQDPAPPKQPAVNPIEAATPLSGKSFEEREITVNVGKYKDYVYKYRLQPPEKVEAGQTYPLVVYLHGAGERGTDNRAQLKYFPEWMAAPEWRKKYPCYVFAPQCRSDEQWVNVPWSAKKSSPLPEQPSDMLAVALAALDEVVAKEPIDKQRIYLTGLSMGGYGSWDLAMRRPDFFAAVAPICGGGDETKAALLKNVPIWAAHGDDDSVVPVERSREMIAALKAAGASPNYSEIPKVGHNSWTPAYKDPEGLTPWMFEQKMK